MPNLIDDLLDGDEGAEGTGDGAAGGPSTGAPDLKSTDKRVRDLQSKADSETARANKAEARLSAMLAAVKDPEEGKPPVGGNAPSDNALELARMFVAARNPKLEEYGISASDLGGSTPSEIAKTAAELVARFEKVETIARNKALAAAGLAPEIVGDVTPPPSRDYSAMSKEDFKKVMDEALNR